MVQGNIFFNKIRRNHQVTPYRFATIDFICILPFFLNRYNLIYPYYSPYQVSE